MTRTRLVFAIAAILASTLPACSSDQPPADSYGDDDDDDDDDGTGGSSGSKTQAGNAGKAGSGTSNAGSKNTAGGAGKAAGTGGSSGSSSGAGGNAAGSKGEGGANTAGNATANKGGAAGKSEGGGGSSGGSVGSGGAAGGGQAGTTSSTGTIERPNGCSASGDLITDFEEGKGVVVKTADRDGLWYVYHDENSGSQTPPKADEGVPIEAAELPAAEQKDCQKYAMHSTASNYTNYVGFGAALKTDGSTKTKVDVSAYDGVKFRIKSGSGTQDNLWFEFLNTVDQPAPDGKATDDTADLYNTRGQMLNGIGTSWTEVFIPFGTVAPRYLPDSSCTKGLCEAGKWSTKEMLGLQFSVLDAFSTAGKYDLWVDDVQFYKGNDGFGAVEGATGNLKFPQDKTFSGCIKPARADGRAIIKLYNKWKGKFVIASGSGQRVSSPEISANSKPCSVSEGIAYGMLIAAYMGDKKLFDNLEAYWKNNSVSGTMLMNWKIGANGTAEGTGSATDADEDAAFALLIAAKQWGDAPYLEDAKKVISDIWSKDIVSNQVTGGSSYNNAWNPSYFAPAFYKVFAKVDTGHDWNAVASNVYTMLNAISSKVTSNLVPAWCSNNCSSPGGTSHTNSGTYQYDSHRMPWRVGLDACWNSNADAKAYVSKLVSFFAGKATSGGIGTIADMYNTDGTVLSGAAYNSMSLIGCAGAGAMASSSQDFLDRAYQFVLDASLTPDKDAQDETKGAYTYYNSTVGLLTALTMTGNFYAP